MTRWNISSIFFLSVSGERRDVTLEPGVMNIITGASGTGKSTLIKAIDYCLGSGKCELPAHVRRRSVAVGVKWTSGDAEMIIGRIVPPVGQDTSGYMFTRSGRNLPLPETVADFDGATNVEAAKAFIERAFGIGDLGLEADEKPGARGRATVRHVTPYLFVTKEVIYSETVLLHGLEKADKARDIIAAMPYFLGVNDEASTLAERRLRQLRRALERELARERSRKAADTALKQRALSLLTEAHRIGIATAPLADASEADLLGAISTLSETQLEANTYPSEGEIGGLHARRRVILDALGAARRQMQAARVAIRDASGFESAVVRQREKLMLAEHLRLQDIEGVCPVCDTPSERGRETARALQVTLATVRGESAAVERVRPRLVEYGGTLEVEIRQLNSDLRQVDDQIQTWLRQTAETRQLANLGQQRAHLLGRVSFFQETSVDERRQPSRDLSVLRAEIDDLESRVDREAKEIKLRRAETKISQFASQTFKSLPTVAPCVGSELDFSTRPPEVVVIEALSDAVLRMPDVGSDQNYLAVHISLSFALQRYFELVKAPVPGLLVLDQISRPYFPTRGEDEDETEILGREEDEDVQAMRQHIDFLFAETARRSGLQVLLIEHAYFGDDPRYVAATRERWTRSSGRALIPLDWPTRADV
jgi:energy-coupling factor transporter ATP-binding protein EcfA2